MKSFVSLSVGCVVLVLAAAVFAQEKAKKEVTLKGSLLCAKCALGEATECTTAIQVKEGEKTVTYLLDDKGEGESYHDAICGGGKKDGTVVGTVEERAGKKYIKPSKVTYVT
jgi:Family of unknown function (DUF6370)